jgi:carbon storage regulator
MPNLILSRRVGETIVINENITITIVGHDSGQTRISIDAPREICIRRGELGAQPKEQAPTPHNADSKARTSVLVRRRKFVHQPDES